MHGAAANGNGAREMKSWLFRFLKGMIIGLGFIVPGISGGVLAAILGLYQRMISFAANIKKNAKEDLPFLLPVFIGIAFGIFILVHPLYFLLDHYLAQVIWAFIGCIIGTLPALWHEAGKSGRSKRHYAIFLISAVISFVLFYAYQNQMYARVELNFFTWILAGVMLVIVTITPGTSTSAFLIFFGIYQPVLEALKTMDFSILGPLALGAVISLYPVFKLTDLLLKKAFASFFHYIAGIVISSTAILISLARSYSEGSSTIICMLIMTLGIAIGFLFGRIKHNV